MTTQVVPPIGGVLLLLCPFVILVLMASAAVELGRRRARDAARLGGLVGTVVVLYVLVLVGAGALSTPQQLTVADTKCFDDWCVRMLGSRRITSTAPLLIDVRLQNRALGRPMKSDLARAYIELPGRGDLRPRDEHRLQQVIKAAGSVDIQLHFDLPAGTAGARFVVTEGSDAISPGTLTIGDEVSPFHARAGWPLTTS